MSARVQVRKTKVDPEREARRERFREIAVKVAGMSDEERARLAAQMATVTIEGHRLSDRNAVLLSFQRPSATIIGGYRQWIAAGRVVKKGERGLMIWAPKQRHDAKEVAEPEETAIAPRGFVPIYVFDVSQTDPLESVAA